MTTRAQIHALAVSTLILAALGAAVPAMATAAPGDPTLVTLPSPGLPLVAVRLLFKVGSIDDPPGKEGLAALTAYMIGQGGTQKHTYSELVDLLYPMAASIEVNVDREVTLVAGTVHRETLGDYTRLLAEAVLEPRFAADDLERNREQLLAFVTSSMRSNDELLGLEMLQERIFAGHPYAHFAAGTEEGLKAITLDDVKDFYARHYSRANLMIGVAGGYAQAYPAELERAFAKLPAGAAARAALPAPRTPQGRELTIVEKETGSVGIHFGHYLPLTWSDADYYALLVANSYLGEHRTFHGRLMQQLRGLRGLNYGDYSYIEYYDAPPFTTTPTPNVPRRQQYFSVWVRPVVPDDAVFALRAALYEVERLIGQGLSEEEFQLTRNFVVNYSKLWAQTLGQRLGFHMDSRYYGVPYYIDEIERRLQALTRDQVNGAVKKHLQTKDLAVVLVGAQAAALQAKLEAGAPSPKTYNSQVPPEVLAADQAIQALPIQPAKIEILPVAEAFKK